MFDELDQVHAWREDGWRFSATTPDMLGMVFRVLATTDIEFRSAVVTPGYRTWLFRTQADAIEFRRLYGVVGL